jgi:uncharacterized protein
LEGDTVKNEQTDPAFLGSGWNFPVVEDDRGQVAMASGTEDIRQAIRIILGTNPGERVMRPDFGAGLRALVFEPLNTTTIQQVKERVRSALVRWEPRIDVLAVYVTTDQPVANELLIEIDYQVRASNTFDNLVYPFYLLERGGP